MRDINNSIGILLRSYTRSINEQEHTTGSLFRKSTHSECLTTIDLHAPSFLNTPNGTIIKQHFPEKEYPQVCFNYIHNNPVKAGLVKHPGDWEFSSYRDYSGSRNGKLINRKRAEEFGLVIDWGFISDSLLVRAYKWGLISEGFTASETLTIKSNLSFVFRKVLHWIKSKSWFYYQWTLKIP